MRRKSHWPEQVNPTMELRAAQRWLLMGLEQDRGGSLLKPDIYRALAICEAVNVIDDVLHLHVQESMNRRINRELLHKEAR